MKEETHHINLDPSDNTIGNLIQLPVGVHQELHEQLAFLINGWKIPINRRDPMHRVLIKYLLTTGEMKFDRKRLVYYITPAEGYLLFDYEKDLRSLGIFPPYIPPTREERVRQAKARLKADRDFMERFLNEVSR